MIYTKTNRPDRRFRVNKTIAAKEFLFWQKYGNYVVVGILGALAGIIVTTSLWRAGHQPSVNTRGGQNIDVGTNKPGAKKLIQEVKAWETPFCFDPITCIRDVGEEIGASNQDIMTMIRIARCESGLRPEAVGINTNKTIDRGIFQINSIHKNLSNADAFNFEKNIRYAWKMQREQGFRPWVCYLKVKNF